MIQMNAQTKKHLIESLEKKFDELKILHYRSSFKFYINKEEYRIKRATILKEGYQLRGCRTGKISNYSNLRKETILDFHIKLNNL